VKPRSRGFRTVKVSVKAPGNPVAHPQRLLRLTRLILWDRVSALPQGFRPARSVP